MTPPKPTTATKADLAAAVHDALQLTKRDAALAVDVVFDAMTKALAEGRELKLSGFGSFATRERPARPGRNPKTGEPVEIPARVVVAFKAAKALQDEVASE